MLVTVENEGYKISGFLQTFPNISIEIILEV